MTQGLTSQDPKRAEALNHQEKRAAAFLHRPLCPTRIATPPWNSDSTGFSAEPKAPPAPQPAPSSPEGPPPPLRQPCGGPEDARRPQTPDSARAPSAASAEPRGKDSRPPDAPEPDPELDAARRAAAADWAMARIRGRVY